MPQEGHPTLPFQVSSEEATVNVELENIPKKRPRPKSQTGPGSTQVEPGSAQKPRQDSETSQRNEQTKTTEDSGSSAGDGADATETTSPHVRIESLPRLDVDYAKVWADQWEYDGGDPAEEATNLDCYLRAIDAVESGELKLPGADGKNLARAIRQWVAAEFREKVPRRQADNLYHRAFYGYLHRAAVTRLATGDLPGVNALPEAAKAIETFVDEEFVRNHFQ